MIMKPGTRVFSAVCDGEFIVVKAPVTDVDLTIGGAPAVTDAGERTGGSVDSGHDGGTLVGKRYGDAAGTLELLCTKAGKGSVAADGVVLAPHEPKLIPSSD